MPLDLGANPATLLPTWLTMDPGDRIDRINHLVEHPTETVRMQTEGYSEVLRTRGWDAQLNVEPYQPWAIGALADTTADTNPILGRLAGDELAAIRGALTPTGMSIAFDPNVYRWTTASDDFPMTVRLGGETVTVSSIATTAATFVAAGAMSSADNAAVTPASTPARRPTTDPVLARIRAASSGVIDTGRPPASSSRRERPGRDATVHQSALWDRIGPDHHPDGWCCRRHRVGGDIRIPQHADLAGRPQRRSGARSRTDQCFGAKRGVPWLADTQVGRADRRLRGAVARR
jgi:hypothetical protein